MVRQLPARGQPDRAVGGSGVSDRVGHRLRGDPVGGDLDGGRQLGEGAVGLDGHLGRAGGAEPVPGQPQRPDQAELVDRGGSQAIDETTDVADRAGDLGPELGQQLLGMVRVRAQLALGSLGAHPDRRQRRTQAVVQVAAQAPALLLAGRDDPLPRCPQVVGQDGRVRRDPDLAGEVVEEADVRVGQGVARPAGRHEQPADLAGAVGEAPLHQLVGSRAVLGRESSGRAVTELERDVREAQRIGDRVHDHPRHRLRVDAPLEALAEPPDGAHRLVTIAVQPPRRGALEDVPDRQGDHGRHARRQQRRRERAEAAEEGSQERRGQGICRDGDDREPAVDDRPADDDVDVEGPVSQDPDGDEGHERQPGQPRDRPRQQRLAAERLGNHPDGEVGDQGQRHHREDAAQQRPVLMRSTAPAPDHDERRHRRRGDGGQERQGSP